MTDGGKTDADVVVVGCGPVGAVVANLLGMHGLRVVVLEREMREHGEPRAFTCDGEALRICHAAGLAGVLRAGMTEPRSILCRGAAGEVLGELRPVADGPSGYPALSFFHQPLLESTLRAGLERFDHVRVCTGHELVALRQDGRGVCLEVLDRGTARLERMTASYVLGCDGAQSAVRMLAGIPLVDRGRRERWLSVTGTAPGEAVRVPEARLVCDPDRPAFVTGWNGGEMRLEFLLRPDESRRAMQYPDTVAALLEPYVDPARFRAGRATVHAYPHRLAARWRAGRVLLLGDAAHQLPPLTGQGVASGVGDAANLAWKLAAVVKGRAEPWLLDTYEMERRPHLAALSRAGAAMARVLLVRSRPAAAVRDRLIRLARRIPRLRELTRWTELVPRQAYARGAFLALPGRARAEGTLFPQARVRTPGGLALSDGALGHGFCLVALDHDARDLLRGSAAGALARLDARVRTVASAPGVVDAGRVGDETGRLAAWFRRHRATVALVRPDRVVFAAGSAADVERISEAAVRWFASSVPRGAPAPAARLAAGPR